MIRIGITGRSGSGKSTVTQMLAALGGKRIDCDEIAHQVIAPGQPAVSELVAVFGPDILENGQIHRKKLGQRAFASPEGTKQLTEITHYYILKETYRLMEELGRNAKKNSFLVVDAPLLIESGLHLAVDSVWVVLADEETCIQRIIARDGISGAQARIRLSRQLSEEKLTAEAHVVIWNQGSRDTLKETVQNELKKVVTTCSTPCD